jgi:hypothetical protein
LVAAAAMGAAVVRRKEWHLQGLLASSRWHKQGTFQKGWHFKGLPLFHMCLKKYAQLLR